MVTLGQRHGGAHDHIVEEDLDVHLVVAAVHTCRVVDRIGVHETAVEGVLDPAPLGEPEIATLGHHAASELGTVHPQAVVRTIADLGVRLGAGLHVGADATVPQQVDGRPEDRCDQVDRAESARADGQHPLRLRRDLDVLGGSCEHAAARRDQRGVVVGPTAARQCEETCTFGEGRLGIRVRIEEHVPVVERCHQPQVRRAEHAIAEDVARHVSDADDGERITIGVLAVRPSMPTNALPRAASGDAHRLVVVADAASRSERIAEPEAVLGSDAVGGVAERGRALVGSDHEIRVVTVVAHGARWRNDGTVDEVVGEIEQAGDERSVAGHALGPLLLRRRRRSLQHEATLRAGGHDHGVLHHLRLHETEHLGAEILGAITPPNAATSDATTAQVHALDARRAHPDLEHRTRGRQVLHLRRVELERHHRAMGTVVARPEHVGAHGRVDEAEKCAQRAVVVEARHGVERCMELDGVPVIDSGLWSEPLFEFVHQLSRDGGVAYHGGLDVLLTEGEADLTQVSRIAAHHLHLSGVQTGGEHETVEPVVLHLAEERCLERLTQPRNGGLVEHDARWQAHTDVVQVHRGLVEGERERALVERPQTEVVEQRQQVGERDRTPASVHAEPPLVGERIGVADHRGAHLTAAPRIGQCRDDR